MMATFTAAAIQSAYIDIAEDLNVSVQRATYLTSLVIAIIGAAPLFWRPLSHVYGRRPIFLLSLVCSAICNVGCGLCHSYATMGLCRALAAFFICPAASIGSAVVSETFFSNERGRYMGIWTAMVTLGVPIAPFIFGFVALRVGYRWIYWTLAIVGKMIRANGMNADFQVDEHCAVYCLFLHRTRDTLHLWSAEEGSSVRPSTIHWIQSYRSHAPDIEGLRSTSVPRHPPLRGHSGGGTRHGISVE